MIFADISLLQQETTSGIPELDGYSSMKMAPAVSRKFGSGAELPIALID
jgi:hypothetical protein